MQTEKNLSPNSPAADLASSIAPEVQKIGDAVGKSLEENLKTKKKRNNGYKPTGRPGGRPRANGAPNASAIDKINAELSGGAQPSAPGETSAGLSPTSDAIGSTSPGRVHVEFPKGALKNVLQLPFNVARSRTGFQGFKLDDQMALDLEPLAAQCINIYFPDTDSKHLPLITLCTTLGSIAYGQYQQYTVFKWNAEQLAIRAAKEAAASQNRPYVQGEERAYMGSAAAAAHALHATPHTTQ